MAVAVSTRRYRSKLKSVGRVVSEHLIDSFFHLLIRFLRLNGNLFGSRAAPDDLLGLGIEQVHDDSSFGIRLNDGRGPKAPAPRPKPIIKVTQPLFFLSGHIDRQAKISTT